MRLVMYFITFCLLQVPTGPQKQINDAQEDCRRPIFNHGSIEIFYFCASPTYKRKTL